MSHLISRILLTVFMLPMAAVTYTTAFVVGIRVIPGGYSSSRETNAFIVSGLIVWLLIAVY